MGLGKGREASATIMDSFNHGQTKAVWVSKSSKLINDARRDWQDIGGDPSIFIELKKVPAGGEIPDRPGILFLTYATLRKGANLSVKYRKVAREDFPDYYTYDRDWLVNFVNKPKFNKWHHVHSLQIETGPHKGKRVGQALHDITGSHVYARATEENVPDKSLLWQVFGFPQPDTGTEKSRLDQVLRWCGDGFEGVICFDESHAAKNAMGDE